jgi:3-oxoacyl-[acyl-carrier-protein] synthase-3
VTPVSLVGAASCMPETVGGNAFYEAAAGGSSGGMFKGSKERRHVLPGETATDLIARATEALRAKTDFRPSADVDLIITNVSCPDMPFTGCGASVARAIGAQPKFIVDMHNTGCVSFVFMIDLARSLMATHGAKTALLCNAQTAAGRVFRHDDNKKRAQSAVPGDGCGVGYLVANAESPVKSVVTKSCGDYADDMRVVSDDHGAWWEPRRTPLYIDFAEERVAKIVARGNALVPAMVRAACEAAEVPVSGIDVLVTNQPNAVFLRNWREALLLPKERHVETFEEYGNLFGAALPIGVERAVDTGKLKKGSVLALGGFAHAGDYAAACVVHWFPS